MSVEKHVSLANFSERTFMTITDIMNVERVLLEIQSRHIFDLEMSEVLTLFSYLRRIGDMTNLFFYVQEMYTDRHGGTDGLEEYRERLMSDGNIGVDGIDDVLSFISNTCTRLGDDELTELAAKMGVLAQNS